MKEAQELKDPTELFYAQPLDVSFVFFIILMFIVYTSSLNLTRLDQPSREYVDCRP